MIRIHLKSPASIGTTREAFSYGRVYFELMNILEKRQDIQMVDSAAKADMQVCWCQPYREWDYLPWFRREHDIQVIYTTFECTSIPQGWDEEINKMSACFTTSLFCADVFLKNGIEVPIHIVPHGVNPEKFPFIERNFNSDKFYFIWQGVHPSDRKGMPLVHRAFKELDLKNAWLIEKWHPLFSARWHFTSEFKRITQYGLIFPPDDYKNLMSMCHVSLNPSRGEGFGMLPLEAAAMGMATAVTNWSGPEDYLNYAPYDSFLPIAHKLSNPGESYFSTAVSIRLKDKDSAQDALPDIDSLKEIMLKLYNNREYAYEIGKRASLYVHEQWNWEIAAQKFVTACKQVLGIKAADATGDNRYAHDYEPVASPHLAEQYV